MRLALDLDRVSQLNLLKVYFWLAQFTDKLELFISSIDKDGGEHYHLVAYDLPDVSDDFIYEMRYAFYDDPIRIWLDQKLTGKPEMVLFSRRVPIETGRPRYRCRLYRILWLPWCSRLPARKVYKPNKLLLHRGKWSRKKNGHGWQGLSTERDA